MKFTSPVTPEVPPPPPIDCAARPIAPAPIVATPLALCTLSGFPSPAIVPDAPTICETPKDPTVSGSGTISEPLPPPPPIACDRRP